MSEQKVLAKYTTDNGKEIVLTPSYIKNYISNDPNVSMEDMHLFAMMCEQYKMNPKLDADLIKYGSSVTIQPKANYWMRTASAHPQFDGMEAGITVITKDGSIERREGCMCGGQTEKLIGGWARVYRKDRKHPSYDEVPLEEYIGRKKDGTPTKAWASMPGTMIRKVAKVHALREAFPECFGGMYDASEMDQARNGQQQEVVQAEVIEAETLQERGAAIIEEYANGERDMYYEEEVVF